MRRAAGLALAGLALLGASACEAPIPGREEIEADAAFTAGEWRDDQGGVWRVRINGRRFNASATDKAHDGQTMRGQIAGGVLTYVLADGHGEEIGQGKAWVAEGQDALYRVTGAAGRPDTHGLMHFNHAPAGAPPAEAATPEASPTPLPPASAAVATPAATPTPEPSATAPEESSPTPDPFSSSPAPSSSDQADPLDLRPPPH